MAEDKTKEIQARLPADLVRDLKGFFEFLPTMNVYQRNVLWLAIDSAYLSGKIAIHDEHLSMLDAVIAKHKAGRQ